MLDPFTSLESDLDDDPFERMTRQLNRDPLDAFLGRRRKRQSLSALPELSDEDESSILADIGAGAMSGIATVGHILDKHTGSRALRGLLGGKPRELASLIPF